MQVQHGGGARIHQEAEGTIAHLYRDHMQSVAALERDFLRLRERGGDHDKNEQDVCAGHHLNSRVTFLRTTSCPLASKMCTSSRRMEFIPWSFLSPLRPGRRGAG